MATKEAQRRAVANYRKKHITDFNLKVNRDTEADIYERLMEQENKSGYIKSLIRKDLAGKILR